MKYKGLILAAGRGSRLKELTDSNPKCLVEVNGKALIEWQLDAFKKAGINDVALVTGYRSELLEANIKFFNQIWDRTNMVYSLLCAEEYFDTNIIVSYSDIIYQAKAINSLMENDNELVITYDPNWNELWEKRFNNPLDDAESFKIDDDDNIIDIGNKVNDINEIQGQYMGLLKISPAILDDIKTLNRSKDINDKTCDMTTLLQKLINSGTKVKGVKYEGVWSEVDDKNDLKVANAIFKNFQ